MDTKPYQIISIELLDGGKALFVSKMDSLKGLLHEHEVVGLALVNEEMTVGEFMEHITQVASHYDGAKH